MSSEKRWRQLGGGSFYKFEEIGQVLEGVWEGTQPGKFGDNGVVSVFGDRKLFRLSAGLKDLLRVKPGGEVRITYDGKKQAKNGNEFNAYTIQVADGADVSDHDEVGGTDDEVPF